LLTVTITTQPTPSSCKVLNKVTDLYELPLIFTGDVNSRIEVAKFANYMWMNYLMKEEYNL